jgi:hypothetical protein
MSDVDKGIETVAEAMWLLIRKSPTDSWETCVHDNPAIAADLRYRAMRAIEDGGLVSSRSNLVDKSAALDLRFKEAFVGSK